MVVDLVVASQFSLSRIRALVLVNKSADDDVYSDSDSNSDFYSIPVLFTVRRVGPISSRRTFACNQINPQKHFLLSYAKRQRCHKCT